MGEFDIDYVAEPTIAKFHSSKAFVRGIMGPIGSGKSVGGFMECYRLAMLQRPQADNIRRSRFACIRNTYPELKTTSIRTFEDWFGGMSSIKYDSPIISITKIGDVEMEIIFLSLDKPADIKKLLSLELTGAFINEAREVPLNVVEMATGRVGRYPSKRDGGCVMSCVFMDTNPPDDDHWWYKLFEDECPQNYELFKQPPALLKIQTDNGVTFIPNPKAENVRNLELGYEYYLRQIPGKKPEWIKVYMLGRYGSSADGRPCYPTYNDATHVSEDQLFMYKDLPLLLGFDFGRTPACIIGQVTPMGALHILDELVVDVEGNGMGLRKFLSTVVRPHINKHYPLAHSIFVKGDPAGSARGQMTEENCFDVLEDEGFPGDPASTNLPDLRIETVEYFLNLSIGDGPGLLLSPTCKVLRKGFLGGYQFERLQISGETRFKDQPKKNRYSHPHDGLQYLADLAKFGMLKTGRVRSRAVGASRVQPLGWT